MINRNIPLQIFTLVLLFFMQFLVPAARSEASKVNIVINEIMYHPPTEFEGEEYIELYNRGKTSVDVSGWKFTKGILYTFPLSTITEPNGSQPSGIFNPLDVLISQLCCLFKVPFCLFPLTSLSVNFAAQDEETNTLNTTKKLSLHE